MRKSDFIFGTFDSSKYANVYKLSPINGTVPEADVDTYHVPGRNGDVIIDNGSWKNVKLSTEVVIECDADDFLDQYHDIKNRLVSQRGYQRLNDSLQPEWWRTARITEVKIKQQVPAGGVIEITWDAKPQIYVGMFYNVYGVYRQNSTLMMTGKGSDVFTAAAIANAHIKQTRVDNRYLLLNLTGMTGTTVKIKATYDRSRIGHSMEYGYFSSNPHTGSGGTCHYFSKLLKKETVTLYSGSLSGVKYFYMYEPINYQVINSAGITYDSFFPSEITIETTYDRDDDDIEYNIDDLTTTFHISELGTLGPRAFNETPVALIGDRQIILSTPATITYEDETYPVESISINWDTYDVYTTVEDDVPVSLNEYVTIGYIDVRSDPGGPVMDVSGIKLTSPLVINTSLTYFERVRVDGVVWRI